MAQSKIFSYKFILFISMTQSQKILHHFWHYGVEWDGERSKCSNANRYIHFTNEFMNLICTLKLVSKQFSFTTAKAQTSKNSQTSIIACLHYDKISRHRHTFQNTYLKLNFSKILFSAHPTWLTHLKYLSSVNRLITEPKSMKKQPVGTCIHTKSFFHENIVSMFRIHNFSSSAW